ncbi:acetyltransferase [Helcobacillus massiliensis]|uniref:Histone acetyltransferase Rv0428c-like SH3 domain-containing protein n=1 Tax=Helcobacillus massiliensis TaxID=521392 RepID=A0A839QUB7_9MICO|nr:acetyltransferase [Helcobacillus massiliensis]MBB3024073.1 hypothetical protein [Helcobacillus massiliensis]
MSGTDSTGPDPSVRPASPDPTGRPGWAPFLQVGVRVTARYRLPTDAAFRASDALGYIRAVDEETITVETKRGFARIPRPIITAVKEVPPPPPRRRPRSQS